MVTKREPADKDSGRNWLPSGAERTVVPLSVIRDALRSSKPNIDLSGERSVRLCQESGGRHSEHTILTAASLLSTWFSAMKMSSINLSRLLDQLDEGRQIALVMYMSKGMRSAARQNTPDLSEVMMFARIAKVVNQPVVIIDESTGDTGRGKLYNMASGWSDVEHQAYLKSLARLLGTLQITMPEIREMLVDQAKLAKCMKDENLLKSDRGRATLRAVIKYNGEEDAVGLARRITATLESRDKKAMGLEDRYIYTSVTAKCDGKLRIGHPTHLLPMHGRALVYYDVLRRRVSIEVVPEDHLIQAQGALISMGLKLVEATQEDGSTLAYVLVPQTESTEPIGALIKLAVENTMQMSVARHRLTVAEHGIMNELLVHRIDRKLTPASVLLCQNK